MGSIAVHCIVPRAVEDFSTDLSDYTTRPDERVSVNRFPKWQK